MLIRALSQSMDVRTMIHVARRVIPDYDIHERTGVPGSLPIPNKNVAGQIVADMADEDRVFPFVELLIAIHNHGFVGRKVTIQELSEILAELAEDGYEFDTVNGSFLENADQRKTTNWGVLRRGESYHLAFLAADVVGNSRLVRRHGRKRMESIYADLRETIVRSVEKRNGRLWSWEGDGGLASFFTGEVATTAVQTGMEILHELLLYNSLWNPLEEPIALRMAIHSGQIRYTDDFSELEACEPVKVVKHIEARHACPGSLTISPSVYGSLDGLLQGWFPMEVAGSGSPACRRYSPAFEKIA
jgi:class 3 adenylate cyclase